MSEREGASLHLLKAGARPMEHEVGVDQPRLNMSLAQGCRLFGRILYVLILFFLLACIMILLIVLNRSGWFALLRGVFGAPPGQGWHRWNACAKNDQKANGERHIGRASSL